MKILNRNINLNTKPFIIAEMSGNHSKSLNTALNIVEAASKSGADAIKLQTYTPNTITLKSKRKDFLTSKKSPWFKYKNLWNLYNYAHTPWKWHKKIFYEAKKIIYLSFQAHLMKLPLTILRN